MAFEARMSYFLCFHVNWNGKEYVKCCCVTSLAFCPSLDLSMSCGLGRTASSLRVSITTTRCVVHAENVGVMRLGCGRST